ncbi:unnamed protein product [Ambrosiozyma monospora]|uniref:Unnamed protein product n=1 Tax=Ambrosiozyma monospora TaxID=43982 RepID=A0A9W6T5X7_AMBMO|nr:unnamed protein product [Ambrosiozyma monospora]
MSISVAYDLISVIVPKHNIKYLPSELLTTTGFSITANTVKPQLFILPFQHSHLTCMVTATATAFIEVTNDFPVVGSWITQQQQRTELRRAKQIFNLPNHNHFVGISETNLDICEWNTCHK